MQKNSGYGSTYAGNRKPLNTLEFDAQPKRPISPSLSSQKNIRKSTDSANITRHPIANHQTNSILIDEQQSPQSTSFLNNFSVLSESSHQKVSEKQSENSRTTSMKSNYQKAVTIPQMERQNSGLSLSPNTSTNFKRNDGLNQQQESKVSPIKKSSHILGNLSGIKASSMIPLSQTEVVGLSSSQSSFHKQDSTQKSKISRLGLSLKPICSSHKHQKIKYICVDATCTSSERVLCDECVQSFGHQLHEIKTIQEYVLLIESSQELFSRKYYHLKQMQERLEKPPFLSDISAGINQLKTSLCQKLDQIKEDVRLEYMKKLADEPSKKDDDSNSQSGSPQKAKKKQISTNSLPDITQQVVLKEVERMDEIKNFWDDIGQKNFFDLTKAELNMSLGMINYKNFIQMDKIQESMSEKYRILNEVFSHSTDVYVKHLSSTFESVLAMNKLEIPPPPKNDPSADQILNDLEKNLLELDNEIKGKRQHQKLIIGQIQSHKTATQNAKNKKNQLSNNILFPYNSYTTSCDHLIELGLEGNTVPIFECCQQAYQCIECHYKFCKHTPKITNPSKRYCMKCISIFKVAFPTDLSINCNECIP